VRRAVETHRPDWVCHLAAYTNVDGCESDADQAFLVNGVGARNAAVAAYEVGAAVLAVSTDYVFPGNEPTPRREYDPIGPVSVYGRSKWAGECGVRETNPRHAIVRTAWLYGQGGRNFVDTIRAKALAGGPLAVVDDQHGAPTWTGDLAAALVTLMERDTRGTFHATNAGECTWHAFAVEICRLAGATIDVATLSSAALARPAQRPAWSVLHLGALEHELGRPMPHWRDALARYLAPSLATRV
jgi:dTDP-4-dehydrorhamnose reductase